MTNGGAAAQISLRRIQAIMRKPSSGQANDWVSWRALPDDLASLDVQALAMNRDEFQALANTAAGLPADQRLAIGTGRCLTP